jgi:hypothetical protein
MRKQQLQRWVGLSGLRGRDPPWASTAPSLGERQVGRRARGAGQRVERHGSRGRFRPQARERDVPTEVWNSA